MPETGSDSAAEICAYPREVVEQVWQLAQVIPGNVPAVWRKDEFGAWLHRQGWPLLDAQVENPHLVTLGVERWPRPAFLEAVAAALFGWAILGEALTLVQSLGGALILFGIWVARPEPKTSGA